MIRIFTQLLFIFLITSNATTGADPLYSFESNEFASLKWGTGSSHVALSKAPANNFGPPSLAVGTSSLYLLDAINQRLLVINLKNKRVSSIALVGNADDVCLLDENRFYVLFADKKRVRLYNRVGKVIKTYSINNGITPIGIQCHDKQGLIIEAFDGHFYRLNQKTPLQFVQFVPIGKYAFSIQRRSGSQWIVRRQDNNKSYISKKIAVENSLGSIENLNIIGVDRAGNIYLTLEIVDVGRSFQRVSRFLRKYTPTGDWVAQVELPYSLYAYTLKDLAVTPAGDVFQILPLPKSFEVIKWRVNGRSKRFVGEAEAEDSLYHQKLFSYLEEQPEDFEPSETSDKAGEDATLFEPSGTSKTWHSGVTRQEIMAKAKSYANYKFKVKSSNLTPRGGDKLGGKVVISPISKTGTYTGIPYKWGGNDSLGAFQRGLNVGKKVGDKCTAKHRKCRGQYFGSAHAAGVDCSGLISQVWGLRYKHSTRNLPRISTRLGSINDLQPGDILNKRGHVRLFSHFNAARRLFVYEATGSRHDWKVVGRAYRLSQLGRYKPYRYKGLVEEQLAGVKKPPLLDKLKDKAIEAIDIVAKIKALSVPRVSVSVRFWLNSPGKTQFSTEDLVTLYYKVNGSNQNRRNRRNRQNRRVYFTLFNVSPKGKWFTFLENEAIEAGQLYSLPKDQKETVRLRLEAGEEYFKAIVTSEPIKWSEFFAAGALARLKFLGMNDLKVDVN